MGMDSLIQRIPFGEFGFVWGLSNVGADELKLVHRESLYATSIIITVLVLLTSLILLIGKTFGKGNKLPPLIPGGLPVLGHILQLSEGRRDGTFAQTFTRWAETYGPIFHVKAGAINNVVINSAELAKEVLVTKYLSISTRRIPTAVAILTRGKTMVPIADYGDEYRLLKKLMVENLLRPNIQAANQLLREHAVSGMLDRLFAEIAGQISTVVDVRHYIKDVLFPFAMQQTSYLRSREDLIGPENNPYLIDKTIHLQVLHRNMLLLRQVFGYVPEAIYVPELGRSVKKWEMFDMMISTPMKMAFTADWRNFFPVFSRLPNRSLENAIRAVEHERTWISNALIDQQKKLLKLRGPTKCFADIILTEAEYLTPVQSQMLLWETLIESTDTTLSTTEWIMYELTKKPKMQQRLYNEISSVVGEGKLKEDDLAKLPLLTAILQETLRFYPPVSILPARYVREDITIGGFDIPNGWEVLVNIHGINRDPKVWSNPDSWNPDRFLNNGTEASISYSRILSFGGGRRLCPGIQQATNIICLTIASFVQHFQWSIPPVDPDQEATTVEDVTNYTSRKLHPLTAAVKPRVSKRLV